MNGLDVKNIRKKLKLTQLEFGELLGVDKRTILNYEKGDVIPPAKIKFIEANFFNEIEKKEIPKKILSLQADSEKIFLNENFILKDHIKTLKESIEDKNTLLGMYIKEITLLKKEIAISSSKTMI